MIEKKKALIIFGTRPEALNAGTVILVGTNKRKIVATATKLLNNKEFYNTISMSHNPYGDGDACKKIVEFILNSPTKK